jgi:hypothetical protein
MNEDYCKGFHENFHDESGHGYQGAHRYDGVQSYGFGNERGASAGDYASDYGLADPSYQRMPEFDNMDENTQNWGCFGFSLIALVIILMALLS